MARRRTGTRAVLHLQQRLEALERRMAAVEAAQRPPGEGGREALGKRPRFRTRRPMGTEGGGADAPDGAQLLATQLLLAGHSRESVATYMRDTLGIEDPDTILDAIGAASG